ncbi:MAG: hypothetical protein PHH22_01395 [Clostridia bacterium]|nr:hypothetical protein [Clostridia bacterium]
MDLDNIINSAIRALPLPNFVENGIIAVKDGVKTFAENVCNKNAVEDLWNAKDEIKNGGVTAGISKVIDIAINNAKKNNDIDLNTAKILKECKGYLLEKFQKDSDMKLIGQEKILTSIEKKYNKLEEAIENSDIKNINKIKNSIVSDYKKLMPTVELINKVENLENKVELLNNKQPDQLNITALEKEILNKIA